MEAFEVWTPTSTTSISASNRSRHVTIRRRGTGEEATSLPDVTACSRACGTQASGRREAWMDGSRNIQVAFLAHRAGRSPDANRRIWVYPEPRGNVNENVVPSSFDERTEIVPPCDRTI